MMETTPVASPQPGQETVQQAEIKVKEEINTKPYETFKGLRRLKRAIADRLMAINAAAKVREPLFYVEPLEEDQKAYTITSKVFGEQTFPHRCSVCLDPATHVKRMRTDSTFRRYLCQKHIHEK